MASERENAAALLLFLSGKGFKGSSLESDIEKSIGLNPPGFKIGHQVRYGAETMFFELQFKKDRQFNAYRLEKYSARHRKAVEVEARVINGIDTAELERRMQEGDWDTWFNNQGVITSPETLKHIDTTIAMLKELSTGKNFDGINIQEALMFKYWPEIGFIGHVSSYDDFKRTYERQRDFHAGEYGICSCNDAYLQVSGKFEDLHEKLQELKLDEYAGLDTYEELSRLLADCPDEFTIKCSHNTTEAYAEFIVPVIKLDGSYSLDEYTMSLHIYPEIQHDIFNGVDTRELEHAMQAINWTNDRELFIVHDGREPEFYPKIDAILQEMYGLEQHEKGAEIAYLLQLKYWQYTSFFETMVSSEAYQLLESLPKIGRNFPCEIDAGIAWNLLCGRAVRDTNVYPFLPESRDWLRLDTEQHAGERNLAFIEVEKFTQHELVTLIKQIPIVASRSVQYRLERGDLVPVTLCNQTKILLQTNPEQKTIDVFTPEKRSIPVNINFDPDWKPAQMPSGEIKKQHEHTARRQVKPVSNVKGVNRKGKGI